MTAGSRQVNPKILDKPSLKIFLLILLRILNHRKIVGESMSPLLSHGDLLIYRSINLKLKEGQIVVFNHPNEKNRLIVKRIHNIKNTGVDVRGDNQSASIDSRQFGLIGKSSILGIVEKVIKHNK